jgi:hypothetical protein
MPMSLRRLTCRGRPSAARPTSERELQERERPGCHPVFRNIGVDGAEQMSWSTTVSGVRTDAKPVADIRAPLRGSRSIASTGSGAGDGFQPPLHSSSARRPWDAIRRSPAMSHRAIAAALALGDMSPGERLAAFSLASFANPQHLAWPGTRIAATRAGLSRSQYLAARDRLARRGLLEVDSPAGGRGSSPVVRLRFAEYQHQASTQVNAELFETVLSYSRCRGSARLLLAVLAAMADGAGLVAGMKSDKLAAAAGIGDSTYRRARKQLLATGEVTLDAAGGGRALTNRWLIADPRHGDLGPLVASTPRPAPAPAARPLVAAARPPATKSESSDEPRSAPDDRQSRPRPSGVLARAESEHRAGTVNSENRPDLTGVSGINPVQSRTVSQRNRPDLTGVTAQNPVQSRTVSTKTPPETPSETPPPNARAGKEPQNLRTTPPSPLKGGNEHRPRSPSGTSASEAVDVSAPSRSISARSLASYEHRTPPTAQAGKRSKPC